jgi:hypothetical protein
MRAAIVALSIVVLGVAPARAGELDALGAEDVREVDRAVSAISVAPAVSPDVLFAAARACEDRLLDPGRAAAIYARIVRDHPDARVSVAAARRLAALREVLGAHDEAAVPAAALAHLIAQADDRPAVEVYARAVALSVAPWPGAPAATRWLADWLRRAERCPLARVHYARVIARWPGTAEAMAALRGATGCALDERDWASAEAWARQLASADPADRAVRDDLLRLAARGRLRDRTYLAAWVIAIAVMIGLAAALAASVRQRARGARRAVLRPPIEVVFLAPVAAVLIGVALTAHRAIAPAVATISLGGLVLAYLSGAQLEALRWCGRARGWRSAGHVGLCLVGVAALVFIAFTRDDLIDLLIETVRFGPDA